MGQGKPSLCLFSRIRGFFIGESRQIIHAGVQGQGHPLALLKAQVPLPALDLGAGTLVNAGEYLHLHLRIAPLYAEAFPSAHFFIPLGKLRQHDPERSCVPGHVSFIPL